MSPYVRSADWPGLFIRGDDAIALLGAVRRLQEFNRSRQEMDLAVGLMGLEQIASIIERDVIAKHSDAG
jgi:hypothetical protein